jgi:signal transduction histidine kinase
MITPLPFSKLDSNRHKLLLNIFWVFLIAALGTGILLELSGVLWRTELSTINRRFEARPWLAWSAESLKRLNLSSILKYHDDHEIPRRWWAWDYTLSWLLENNHPPVKHKIIIFNHSFEDEPPAEAVRSHDWMAPLLQYPVSRNTMADVVEFIARSGAKLIVLDADFPQYSAGDQNLARSIHLCSQGTTAGHPVPVLMTASVTTKSYDNVIQLHTFSPPRGVIEALTELEPDKDVINEYTGSAGILLDEDQVVRQLACFLPGRTDEVQESVVIKGLQRLGEKIPSNLPAGLDIDFAGPPNNELYKIRPFWYLLDPEHRRILAGTAKNEGEPSLKDAVVIIGDGITDLHNTPYTNLGANLRTGSEILAQAFDTIGRGHWPQRLSLPERLVYLFAVVSMAGLLIALWKSRFYTTVPRQKGLTAWYLRRILPDLAISSASVVISYLVACQLFASNGMLVPVVVPAVALLAGALTAAVWQTQHQQMEALTHELADAKTRLSLIHEKHEAELREQAATARADAIQQDRERRREFGRRLNHDLKAPLSILNWTLAKMRSDGLTSSGAEDKLERLFKTANRLFNLIGELSRSYDFEIVPGGLKHDARCSIREVITDCVTLHRAVADMMGSKVEMVLAENDVFARVGVFQLTRIIDNLIGNALVHNPAGTTVRVRIEPGVEQHAIEISDNGVGIPLEKLGDKMKKGSEKGTSGLGLSIVHGLVRDLEGELKIKSSADRGTSILVFIPAAPLDEQNEVPQGEPISTISNNEESDTCAAKGAR